MPDIEELLTDLANKIADDLKGEAVTLNQRLEAFRILATYDASVKKAKAKLAADEDDEIRGAFTRMKRKIQEVA